MFGAAIEPEGQLALLEERHAAELFALVHKNRDHLRPWMGWVDGTESEDDIRVYIRGGLERFAKNNGFQVGIWHRGKIAGVLGLQSIDWANKKSSLGYWIDKDHQGLGLVTNACAAVLQHAFKELGLNRISIGCAPENERSKAIPKRLGFKNEGVQRQSEWLCDHFVDHESFGLLKEEWEQRS